jgi:hypothetical protein
MPTSPHESQGHCAVCGGPLYSSTTTYVAQCAGRTYRFDHVPAARRGVCDLDYLALPVLHHLYRRLACGRWVGSRYWPS